jgi:CheY-like chemotaxis protein
VRRLCDLLAIKISVESAEGQGTTFTLQLKAGDPKLIEQVRPHAKMSNISDISILVIDDEQSVREGMQTILTSWQSKVMLAESAEQAITVIHQHNFVPDIILADYRLRNNKTGVDAVAVVREELNIDVPAIIITGDTSPERLKQVSESGFHLMHKPVTPDALHQALISMNIAPSSSGRGLG